MCGARLKLAPKPPHNPGMVMTGAAMLWVGWFGFNAGSAAAADIARGKVTNNRTEMKFEGIDRRSFSFDFKMIPKSEKESNNKMARIMIEYLFCETCKARRKSTPHYGPLKRQ